MYLFKTIGEAFTEVISWIGITINAINNWFGFPISEISIIGLVIVIIYKMIRH